MLISSEPPVPKFNSASGFIVISSLPPTVEIVVSPSNLKFPLKKFVPVPLELMFPLAVMFPLTSIPTSLIFKSPDVSQLSSI